MLGFGFWLSGLLAASTKYHDLLDYLNWTKRNQFHRFAKGCTKLLPLLSDSLKKTVLLSRKVHLLFLPIYEILTVLLDS